MSQLDINHFFGAFNYKLLALYLLEYIPDEGPNCVIRYLLSTTLINLDAQIRGTKTKYPVAGFSCNLPLLKAIWRFLYFAAKGSLKIVTTKMGVFLKGEGPVSMI